MTDRTIPRDRIDAMTAQVAPKWEVHGASLADSGYLRVYHLELATPDGPRRCVLKAAPEGEAGEHGVALEAHLLRGLADRTDLPVPDVLGAVEAHDHLPAPYFLLQELPGESVPRKEMDGLTQGEYERIARQVGHHLAELHDLDVVDAFGFPTVVADDPLAGERPPPGFEGVGVADPADDWPALVRRWADDALDRLEETRFADLRDEIAPALHERVDALEGPFRPAVGHVDGAVENLLLDDDRTVVGMLDWAFTLAVPPAYDLLFVEQSLAGGHWRMIPSAPDVRRSVRRGLREGYRERGRERPLRRLRDHRDCYELLALVNSMTHFTDWFEARDTTDEQVAAAAENHRRAVRDLL